MKTQSTKIDIVVVGGGAAGLMAAIHAKTATNTVMVIEKNAVCGKKLRITGGGRCNITNNIESVRTLVSRYREAGKFLFSPFSQFGVADTIDWFSSHGVPVYEEAEGRMFPVSQSAVAVTEALLTEAKRVGVVFKTRSAVTNLVEHNGVFHITLDNNGTYEASKVILATGGTSRPETGSTGDGLPWLKKLGHSVTTPTAALVPVAVEELALTKRLGGVALRDCQVTVYVESKRLIKLRGKVLFAHFGLTGPAILNLSQRIGAALADMSDVYITFDLCPDVPQNELQQKFLSALIASSNKLVRNILPDFVQSALATPLLEAVGIPINQPSHSLTVENRKKLIAEIKAWRFTPTGLLGKDKAVISSGGVALTEVDFRTMESQLVSGLYLVGDVLDINRPTGGYSLQLAWTTGVVAGRAASGQVRDKKRH